MLDIYSIYNCIESIVGFKIYFQKYSLCDLNQITLIIRETYSLKILPGRTCKTDSQG